LKINPRIECLEQRQNPSSLAIGAPRGALPIVQLQDTETGAIRSLTAFEPSFRGGVNVAVGDVTGDGISDVIAGRMTGRGEIRIFDGASLTLVRSIMAFTSRSYRGGVEVAYGHFDEEQGMIVAATGQGSPIVKVFDAPTFNLHSQFRPYNSLVNGVNLAVADLNSDSVSEIITGPKSGGLSIVRGFDTKGVSLYAFQAYSTERGVQVIAGDFDGNNAPDIATAPEQSASPLVRIWTRDQGSPALSSEFLAFGSTTPREIVIGTADQGDATDLVAIAPVSNGRQGASTLAKAILIVSPGGAAMGSVAFQGAGAGKTSLASALDTFSKPYDGPVYHAIGYSPTYPNWAPTPGTQFQGSDLTNQAFVGLWNTPRVPNPNGGGLVTDLEAMKIAGFNAMRLYNWDPARGFVPGSDPPQFTQHIPFLDALHTQGLKLIFPISNYFLSDQDFAWWVPTGNPAPNNYTKYNADFDYTFGSASPNIQDDLRQFVSSITKDGALHPAIAAIEIGNEIDLNVFVETHGNATQIVRRAIWWIVNLQKELKARFPDDPRLNPSNPNRLRYTIPVSNADEDSSWLANKSWFQIFRNGAAQNQLTPGGPANGTVFAEAVKGINAIKLPDSGLYNWFFNSYQTFQTGQGLQNIMEKYNAQSNNGPNWNSKWPGMQFEVPLLFTELGSKLVTQGGNLPVEHVTEDRYYTEVAEEQALIAEKFLRGMARDSQQNLIENRTFAGYTIFEWNDEPNKNGYNLPNPDPETNRGIFKYYTTMNVLDFRNAVPVNPSMPTQQTGPTSLPFSPFTWASQPYPVYKLFPIRNMRGKTLISRLSEIIKNGA
jgi:hypothetical protein